MSTMSTSESTRIPTIAKESATLTVAGLVGIVVGMALILLTPYASLQSIQSDSYSSGPEAATILLWCGLIGLVIGVTMLGVGLFRLLQHADRAAGVLFTPPAPRGPRPGE